MLLEPILDVCIIVVCISAEPNPAQGLCGLTGVLALDSCAWCLLGEPGMEGGGRYLLFRARRSKSLRDRAYRPAGTIRGEADAYHQFWTCM